MNLIDKIYIAGHNGLIGSAFLRYFRNNDYNNIIYKKRSELDLSSREDTYNFFKENTLKNILKILKLLGWGEIWVGLYLTNIQLKKLDKLLV